MQNLKDIGYEKIIAAKMVVLFQLVSNSIKLIEFFPDISNFINFENDTSTLSLSLYIYIYIYQILTTEPPPSKNYYYSHITSHQTKLSLKWITNNKYQQNFVNFLLKFNI